MILLKKILKIFILLTITIFLCHTVAFAMTVSEFYELAKKHSEINAFAVTVQSALETGNWTSLLWCEANNGLGIKANSKWIKSGKPYVAKTSREANGSVFYKKVSNFRKYSSAEQFLVDFKDKIRDDYPVCAKNYDNTWGYYAGLYQGRFGKWATDQKYFENLVTKTIRTAPDIYAEAWQDKLLMDYQMALYRGLLSPWQKEILEIKLQAAGIL